jgi:RsiW-degrading membrane proteinase PrsW (M82 family)
MVKDRDPVEVAADDDTDLYDVATWEERSSLDGLAVALYRLFVGSARFAILLVAFLILLAIGGLSALTDPQVGTLTLLSAVPALAFTAYVWYSDVTESEPLSLLVVTFLLAVLTANFAAVVNSLLKPRFDVLGFPGLVLFFYLVVGPVEESVKLLAVRLHAYRSSSFNSVIDGTVYGAVAGLGFATIENALYITQRVDVADLEFGAGLIGVGGGITAIRALAGPGHVIYSAIAGYYLGLAKFNRANAGPIIVKGLILASLVHATYNTLVAPASTLIAAFTPLGSFAAFIAFVVLYDGVFGLYIYRKIRRYSDVYRATRDEKDEATLGSELTEFENDTDFDPESDRDASASQGDDGRGRETTDDAGTEGSRSDEERAQRNDGQSGERPDTDEAGAEETADGKAQDETSFRFDAPQADPDERSTSNRPERDER